MFESVGPQTPAHFVGCSCPLLCEDPELSAGLSDTAALLRRLMAEAGLLMVGRAPARPCAAPGTWLSS